VSWLAAARDWYLGLSRTLRGWLIASTAAVVVGLIAFIWIVGGPGPFDFAKGPKVALADYHGADPTGVPAALKNASLVKRGEYLAHAADCMVCHTAQGGKEYAGGFAFTLPFGTLYSSNITPDRETGIGNYTDTQFLAAVRRGVRADGKHLYPAMSFTSYTYMTDADVLAIKAYLFSLAPVHAPARANGLIFPFNQRWLIGMWTWLFNADTRFEPDTAKSPQWNRGAYIAEALAHCGECHTPRNLAFALNNRRKFAGAVTAGWRAYNISSDNDTGVGAWGDQALFAYLATGHAAGRGTATGPMGEAVDQSFSKLAPEDMRAVVAYLRSVPAKTSDLPATLAPPASSSHTIGPALASERGKQVFEGACASCHGWTGVSPIIPFATLTGSRAVNDPSATNVAQVVILGAKRITPRGVVTMPAFGSAYSNAEIAAVANYVTARFGSKGARLTEKDVASLRAQSAQN
jgi:mono/diheme cytochrome c family protein